MFPLQFASYSFFELPEKPPHASVKPFLLYMAVFCEIGAFPLGVFSIRDFNLAHILVKGQRQVLVYKNT